MQTLTQTQRIHADFKNALNLSAIKVSDIKVSEEPVHKNFLESIGMTSSKTYEREKIKESTIRSTKEMKSVLDQLKEIEAQYPQYRIISLSKVIGLMKKYNLCFGTLGDYTSTIPTQNIEELKEYHEKALNKISSRYSNVRRLLTGQANHGWDPNYFIAAPRAFFKAKLTSVDGFLVDEIAKPKFKYEFGKIAEPTDPIIMNPLAIMGPDRFMHIATAWDVEADDELVTNKIKLIQNNN